MRGVRAIHHRYKPCRLRTGAAALLRECKCSLQNIYASSSEVFRAGYWPVIQPHHVRVDASAYGLVRSIVNIHSHYFMKKMLHRFLHHISTMSTRSWVPDIFWRQRVIHHKLKRRVSSGHALAKSTQPRLLNTSALEMVLATPCQKRGVDRHAQDTRRCCGPNRGSYIDACPPSEALVATWREHR